MCLTCLMPGLMVDGATPVFTDTVPAPGWLGRDLGGTLTWTGCAGFVFDVGGERIAFDPYVSNPGPLDLLLRPARPDAALVERTFGTPKAVFVGHTHFDHAMDVPTLAHAGSVVHGSATTTEICRRHGVPDDRLVTVHDGDRVTVGPFTVEAIGSRHGTVPVAGRVDVIELKGTGLPRTAFRWPRGAVFAYRVEVGGTAFHLQTSAGIEDAPLARQQPVDVLVACLAARQGTPRYLARLADRLQPRIIIPCHHDNFLRPLSEPPRPVPRLDWDDFLADVAAMGARLVRLPRGAAVSLS